MIPVDFNPQQATNQVLIMPYPLWTVLGVIVVVAVIAGLVLWYKTRGAKDENK